MLCLNEVGSPVSSIDLTGDLNEISVTSLRQRLLETHFSMQGHLENIV